MDSQNHHLVIDAGNTSVKVAIFQNGVITSVKRTETEKFLSLCQTVERIQEATDNQVQYKGMISSVLDSEGTHIITAAYPRLVVLDKAFKLPITLNYETPNTLGIDRICNAVAIWNKNKNSGSVSIDIGSCIKFDYVDKNGVYQGGSISPGLKLRYKSMNDYTANLPLLHETSFPLLIGKSTKGSMQAGVIQGMYAEINGFIERYLEIDSDLTFFMTGGDAKYFDFHSKNNIFAIENLTLEGLYQIFLFNDR